MKNEKYVCLQTIKCCSLIENFDCTLPLENQWTSNEAKGLLIYIHCPLHGTLGKIRLKLTSFTNYLVQF